MSPFKKPANWFKIGLAGLFVCSLALRFWGLSRFNTLVFDEVYYVKFAHKYLSQKPFFDGHPPLSKYLIAIGIWLGNQLPIGQDTINSMAGAPYTTWSYRWLNALTGSFIPLVVSGIGYQLTRRYSYAFIAGLLVALDGLFLVESRYALNNVYLDILGLLGLWWMLLALNSQRPLWKAAYLAGSGIFFGASASIKWNGLWFLLGAYGLWMSAWVIRWARTIDRPPDPVLRHELERSSANPVANTSPLQRLTRLKIWQVGLNWAVIPAVFYFLIWIPHLLLNAQQGIWQDFWTLQKQILDYHERVGSGPTVHPYCSTWYSWLLMWRPVAYFYQVTDRGAPLPTGKSAAAVTADKVIYDVHAMGNPVLWWLSTAAIAIVLSVLVQRWFNWVSGKEASVQSPLPHERDDALSANEWWLLLFLAVNYVAQLLPWVRVSRCIFLYHYMGASIFAMMAIAWLVDRWLCSREHSHRMIGIATVLVITLAFVFWLPIYLGLPLSPLEFRLRIWFPSWI